MSDDKTVATVGAPAPALTDSRRADRQRTGIHASLLEDVMKGLDDIDNDRTMSAEQAMEQLRLRRRSLG